MTRPGSCPPPPRLLRRAPGRALAAWTLAFATIGALPGPRFPALFAHESLYHYVELRLPREPGPAELSFSVHAAELESAVRAGVAPDAPDLEWLRPLGTPGLAALLAEADSFIRSTFSLEAPGTLPEAGAAVDLPLRFPSPERLLEAPGDSAGARPGFLLGLLELPEAELAGWHLRLSPEAGKRLLLVLHRPGSFPQVRDLAPGEAAPLLPHPGPRSPRSETPTGTMP